MNGFGDWNNRVGLAGCCCSQLMGCPRQKGFLSPQGENPETEFVVIGFSQRALFSWWRESPTFAHIVPFAWISPGNWQKGLGAQNNGPINGHHLAPT